jgi:hypothetical protein
MLKEGGYLNVISRHLTNVFLAWFDPIRPEIEVSIETFNRLNSTTTWSFWLGVSLYHTHTVPHGQCPTLT